MTIEGHTFSSIIDEALALSGRGAASKNSILKYARSSMREAQIQAFFHRDRIELSITATAQPHIWTSPNTIRMIETVRYPGNVYPAFITPGKLQRDPSELQDEYYYAASNYYAFANIDVGDTIDISYFSYFRSFIYYATAVRPARFDLDTLTWEYLDNDGNYVASLSTTALEEAARDKVTNWLIFNWTELVLEGTLAKQFKIIKDDKAGATFSLFERFKKDLLTAEPYESLDR